MPTEIEAKLKVDSLTAVSKRLKSLKAKFLKKVIQRDYYFDDSKKSLTKADKCLRLREETSNKKTKVVLAFKGPKQKGKFKTRDEFQMELPDAKTAKLMIEGISFKSMLTFEKKRQLWFLGNCEIALDELDLIGNFVEIEGTSENQISRVQKKLGLSDFPHINQSYALLMEKAIKQKGKNKN